MPLRADDGHFDRNYNKHLRQTYLNAVDRRRERNKRQTATRNARRRLAEETANLSGNPEAARDNASTSSED